MRIGLISGEYPPLQGGVGAYTRILGLALADAGHTVSVLAGPGALENDPRLTLDRVDGWGYGCWNAVATWARYRRLDVMDLQYQTAAYGMSAWIHFLPALARVAPWVVTFHDLRFPYLFPKAGPVRPWIVNRLARSADGVIATNPEDYAALRQLPHAALVPIGSNIPPSDENQDHATVRARYGIGPDEPLIVNFGLINRSKGLDELVEAVAALHSRDLAARALLVGSSGSSDPTNQAYEAELRARITAAGLNQAVVITGYLGEADVYTLLKAADVVALPFRDGASMRRGSLMAALAAGCAVITTTPAVPTPGFIDGVAMRLTPPGDAAALADALANVLQRTELRRRLQEGAIALSRQFAWPAIAESVAAFLQRVAEASR